MASVKTLLLIALCFFLILTFYVPDTDSARGGFRSSSRSYRSRVRVRSGTRVRVRQRVGGGYYGGRIRRGSSMFSSNTWKAAALAGAIYGGSRYLKGSYYRRYPNRMPPICTNNFELAPNGRVYGHFICPRESDPATYTWCCGESQNEFCCDQNYYSRNRHSGHRKGMSPGAIVGIVLVIILIIVIAICCCRRYKQNGAIFGGGKSKPGSRTVFSPTESSQVTMPMKSPDDDQHGEMKANYHPASPPPEGAHTYPPPPNPSYPQPQGQYPPGPYPQGDQYPPPGGQYPPPGGQYPPGPYPPPDGGMPYPSAGGPPPYTDSSAPPYPGGPNPGAPNPGMPAPYGYGQPSSGYPPYPQ